MVQIRRIYKLDKNPEEKSLMPRRRLINEPNDIF